MLDIKTITSYKDLHITDFPNGTSVVWRLLSLREYDIITKLRAKSVYTVEEAKINAFKLAVVNDISFSDKWRAGIISTIGELILWFSGDCESTSLKEDILAARNIWKTNTVIDVMFTTITIAFPSYTIQMLEDLNRKDFFKLFTMAENKLQLTLGDKFSKLDVSKIGVPEIEKRGGFQVINTELENLNNRGLVDPLAEIDLQTEQHKLKKEHARALDSRGK